MNFKRVWQEFKGEFQQLLAYIRNTTEDDIREAIKDWLERDPVVMFLHRADGSSTPIEYPDKE